MALFTIPSIGKHLDARLTEKERLTGISKNQFINDIPSQDTGLQGPAGHADGYAEFCGIRTAAEKAEFDAPQADNRGVDPADRES